MKWSAYNKGNFFTHVKRVIVILAKNVMNRIQYAIAYGEKLKCLGSKDFIIKPIS